VKIYISGPISGTDDYVERFKAAEAKILAAGQTTVNPASVTGSFDYRTYINRGLARLAECDAIYLMEGWRNSKGARLEQRYAETVGLMEYEETYGTWTRLPKFELSE